MPAAQTTEVLSRRGEPEYLTPRLQRWRARTDTPLVILAVGSLPLLLVELARSRLPHSDRILIDVVNVVVLVAFAVDYAVELAVATNRSQYVRRSFAATRLRSRSGFPASRAYVRPQPSRSQKTWARAGECTPSSTHSGGHSLP